MSSIFQDTECIKGKAHISPLTMAIYTVRGDGDGPGGRVADVGVVQEGVQVLNELQSVHFACIMFYGLIYALNLIWSIPEDPDGPGLTWTFNKSTST